MTDSLLSRLEALTEPSREFDALIWAEQDNREAIDDYTCDIWIEDKQIKACGPTPADHCWPGERHYTKVDPAAVRSTNPGFCFIAAGWKRCGTTKNGKLILEKVNDALLIAIEKAKEDSKP